MKKFVSTFLVMVTFFTSISMAFCSEEKDYFLGNVKLRPGEEKCFPYKISKEDVDETFFAMDDSFISDRNVTFFSREEDNYYKFCVVNNEEEEISLGLRMNSDDQIKLKKVHDFWTGFIAFMVGGVLPLLATVLCFNRKIKFLKFIKIIL